MAYSTRISSSFSHLPAPGCGPAASLRGALEALKVRAITGFITIDAKSYPSQIEETVKFLNLVRQAITSAGYEVEGIRIST